MTAPATDAAIPARQDRPGAGIAMMLAAWALFASTDTAVKWLVVAGLGAIQLAFARYAAQLALSLAAGVLSGRILEIALPRRVGLLALRAGLLISATVLNFHALKFLPLTTVSAIMFSSPILVCALSGPLLGERAGPWRQLAIATGFAGVLCVVRPFGDQFHWAALLVVYNAFALAMFSILTRKLAGEISPQVMQLYMGVLGTAALLPFTPFHWQPVGGALHWALFAGLGVVAWAGHELFARSHFLAEASLLMPFSYSFLVYVTASSWIVFGDLPDGMTVLGAGIIVVSGLLIWWRERVNRPGAGTTRSGRA